MKRRAASYKEDFFNALLYLIERRKLVLLIESRIPFIYLLPEVNPLSRIQAEIVEMRGR